MDDYDKELLEVVGMIRRIVEALKSGPKTRTEINFLFAGHVLSSKIQRSLIGLQMGGIIFTDIERTGGRPITRFSLNPGAYLPPDNEGGFYLSMEIDGKRKFVSRYSENGNIVFSDVEQEARKFPDVLTAQDFARVSGLFQKEFHVTCG